MAVNVDNRLKLLGENIAFYRERAGFSSQAKFANEVGVKQGTVSSWENGEINIPYTTLCQIAEKLGTSPASLADRSVPVSRSLDLDRLDSIRAVIFANSTEMLSIRAACNTVLERLFAGKKKQSSR